MKNIKLIIGNIFQLVSYDPGKMIQYMFIKCLPLHQEKVEGTHFCYKFDCEYSSNLEKVPSSIMVVADSNNSPSTKETLLP